MSVLKETLELIEDWVQKNMPAHPAVMKQGLSRGEIEDKVKDLPFKLPNEIYDLYQWHNGGKEPFIPHPDGWDLASFSSLEEAISAAQTWKNLVMFPLFMIEDNGYFTVCTQEKSDIAPIYSSDIPEDVIEGEPQYSSLTVMMQKLINELRNRE